jgi:hypothetical protein
LIVDLVSQPGETTYARAIAVQALLILVAFDEKLLSEIVDYCKSLFDGKLERKHSQDMCGGNYTRVKRSLTCESPRAYP